MKRFLAYLMSFACVASAMAQSTGTLRSTQYDVTLKKNGSVMVTFKPAGKTYQLYPRFTIMKRDDDPKLRFKGAAAFMKQPVGSVRVPYWNGMDGKTPEADFFKAANKMTVTAKSGTIKNNRIEWNVADNSQFTIKAVLSLDDEKGPAIDYSFVPKQEAWYSIGFTGMPELSLSQADAIWQPTVWQEKRFPELSFLSTEDICSALPGTMVEEKGTTLGLFADPTVLPYRMPFKDGRMKFGVILRNAQGKAQPMVFAPILGNIDSKLQPGATHHFKLRVFAFQGKQTDAYISATQKLFNFKDYRQNVYFNLNQTIENMIDFQMDDVYSRWSADMKGFDYSTDVANTVKNVSGLHPLATAVITDDKGIYARRALPMIEYLISREKYLFSVNKNITRQQPSSRMAGPAVEVSELAALDVFARCKSPVFAYFADSLSHTTRQLNLTKESKGDDWPNLVALYKMTGKQEYLDKAKQKADEYINWRITQKQTDFRDASAKQAAQFWTDFAPLWIELLYLYEVSGDKKYLDAATEGAKLYMQYVWFYPVIPDSTLHINQNGIVEYLCLEAIRDTIPAMAAPPQQVPAWQVSQIGLTPEAANTIADNQAIFLTHYAPHLLRLAHYTNNEFFRWVARSAVVGRYANYPGYDINGEFNTVYSRADYPLRYQHEVSYNQFYYNHVWPQIAMLFDYLVSDVYASSKGNIHFPSEFAVGYAYLKSNVYGQAPGSFYGEKNVQLWMPSQVLNVDNEQINYLTAYGNGKFYVALLNQCDSAVEVTVKLNPGLVPVGDNNSAGIWQDNGARQPFSFSKNTFKVRVSAKGITALAIDKVPVVTQFQQEFMRETATPGSFKMIETPFGKVRSAMLTFGELSNAYIWLEASVEKVQKATINYRLGKEGKWKTMEDASYPFEFSIPVDQQIEWWIEAQSNGSVNKSNNVVLTK